MIATDSTNDRPPRHNPPLSFLSLAAPPVSDVLTNEGGGV